jgi:integrase
MASVHKNPSARSPFWFAAFRGPDGRRIKKSTKTTDRSLAMKLAYEWESLARKGKAGALVAAQARRVVAEITEIATGEPLQFKTAKEFLHQWLRSKEGTNSRSTFLKYRQTVSEFIELLGKKALHPIEAISSADVTGYRERCLTKGRTPTTANNLLKVINQPFEAALKQGIIPHNPCKAVDRLRDPGKQSRGTFTAEQLADLLKAAEGDWHGTILFGYYTQLRLRDIVNLRWENLLLDEGEVCLKVQKTGLHHSVILHPDVLRWLRERPKASQKAFVFPDLGNSPQQHLSERFKRLMKKAGINSAKIRTRRGESGRSLSLLSFHSLRHTGISAMANAGVAEDIRMKVAGHASQDVHKRYTHHEKEVFRKAISAIPSVLRFR